MGHISVIIVLGKLLGIIFYRILNLILTLGRNTSKTVVDVESWVRMKPSKYFISGPALGKINKLKQSRGSISLKYFFRNFSKNVCVLCGEERTMRKIKLSEWFKVFLIK